MRYGTSPKHFLNREHNDDYVEDNGNAKEEQTELKPQKVKEKRVLELSRDVEDCKGKLRSWIDKPLSRINS